MFFTDTADFKKYIPVNASFDFNSIEIYLKDADRTFLKPVLGSTFMAELQNAWNLSVAESPTAPNSYIAAALELVRTATAHTALAKWLPFGQVNIDDSGIRIAVTDSMKTAFGWQIDNIEENCLTLANNALDELIVYLESNLDHFTTYRDSEERKKNISLFIKTAEQFCEHYSGMRSSPLQYLRLRSIIKKTEDFYIKPTLLPDYFAELKTKTITPADITEEDDEILKLIYPALAHLTISRAVNELSAGISKEGFLIFDNSAPADFYKAQKAADYSVVKKMGDAAEKDGLTYLADLKKYIEKNKADYPTYTNDAQYESDSTTTNLNDGTRPFFVA